MFSRTYIFLLGGLILWGSCQNNQENPLSGDQPIVFNPAIGEDILTRASNNSWDANDRVGIYMIPHVTNGSADLSAATAEATNIAYRTVSSGTSSDLIAVGNYIRYPLDNSEVNFIAYYPFKPDVHEVHNHIYPVDVSTQNPLTDIDLLYHNGAGTAYQRTPARTVLLVFTHQLSKLTITIKPTADVNVDLTDAKVSLTGFPTKNTFDLSNGSLGNPSDPSTKADPILPVADEDRLSATELFCEAILVPHEGPAFNRVMTVTIGEESYSYTFPSTLDMDTGMAYSYDFTFTGSRIILAQNTIENWNEIGKGEHKLGKDLPDNWDEAIDWTQPIVFDGPSNCYAVPRNTQLLIPISRAYEFAKNTTYGTEAGHPVIEEEEAFYGKVYWQDTQGVLAANDPITPCGVGPTGYLLVKTGTADGNALVAVQKKINDEFVTLWSWHVWVTDYDPNTGPTFTNTYNTNNNGKHFVFMDRNLGATFAGTGSGKGTGLFYQWGRKDPFPATGETGDIQEGGGSFIAEPTSETVGTVANTVKNPNVFITAIQMEYDWNYSQRNNNLWGHYGDKSIYDPCPVGWRVPVNSGMSEVTSPWYNFKKENAGQFDGGYKWGDNAVFPVPGWRILSTKGLLTSVGTTATFWTASPHTETSFKASYFSFNTDVVYVYGFNSGYRSEGYSIRCVSDN